MTSLPRIAFLFPGQGSQAVGMGKELANNYSIASETFEEADDALDCKLSRFCFEGPEEKLKMTEITQPAIVTTSVAALRVLGEKGLVAQYFAGHSLGEYTAHVAAGTLSFRDAVRTVRNRGKYMQEAVPVGVGAMAAIVGLTLDKVVQVTEDSAHGDVCQVASVNAPQQIVISGHATAVHRAIQLARERGARRAVCLPVSAPFHCALMRPAQRRLEEELRTVAMQNPSGTVVCNVDATVVRSSEAARDALIRQVTGAVKWDTSVHALAREGATLFVEIGPGMVLSGLMQQIEALSTCLAVSDDASLRSTLAHAFETVNT